MMKRAARPETNLVQIRCPRTMDAPVIFGTKTAEGGTPIVLIPNKQHSFKMKIPIGTNAIVSRRGASVGIYPPGLYYRPFFYRIDYLVTTHHIPYHFSIRSCPTKDNVLIHLEVDFLLHIQDPETFVFSIGPENMEELLRATQAETVRGLVRSVSVNEAYDLRGYESSEMLTTLNEKMNAYGIFVDQVTIANVTLPDELAISMQKETTFETKQFEQTKKQEYELRIQTDQNIIQRLNVDRKNEELRVQEEGRKQVAKIQHEIDEFEARITAILEDIQTEEIGEVKCIKAQTELELAEKRNEILMMTSEIATTGKMESEKILAQAEKQVVEKKAAAQVSVAKNKAEMTRMLAEAEFHVAESLQSKRAYDIAQLKCETLSSLANNPHVVIAGESGDNVMQMMMVRESAKVLGIAKNA